MGQLRAVLHLFWSFKLRKGTVTQNENPQFFLFESQSWETFAFICLFGILLHSECCIQPVEDAFRLNQVHRDKTRSPACWSKEKVCVCLGVGLVSGVENIVHG